MFLINWNVTDTQWEHARRTFGREDRGSLFDRHGMAFFSLVRGSMQFTVDDQLLFPKDRLLEVEERRRTNHVEAGDPWFPIPADYGAKGRNSDPLDFADKLIVILGNLVATTAIRSPSTMFRPNDGGTQFLFGRNRDTITIETDLLPDLRLHVPFDDFMSEVHRFLRVFITTLNQQVPGILYWVSFERLYTYAQAHGIITTGDDIPPETSNANATANGGQPAMAANATLREYWGRGGELRAELRELYVLHDNAYRTVEEFTPDDPTCFRVEVTAAIGPATLTGEEEFEFVLGTPNWLASEPLEQGFRWGQDHLFVDAWDPILVRRLFHDLCHQTQGGDWTTIAMKLSHFGRWQYDSYREFP